MTVAINPSYAASRASFLDIAEAAGASLTSTKHPQLGLHGEELFVDVAHLAAADSPTALVVVSGTHGVEGYLGSALQRHHLLNDQLRADGIQLWFIHALNPYGFSWVRRVNEDNIDLNRNFIDWSQSTPPNPGYGSIADLLVPTDWSTETQERVFGELMAKADELGFERFQQIITQGQFEHPTGLFYGGTGPAWSNTWLSGFLQANLADCDHVAVIDLHTGLGPWGHGELISCDLPGSPEFERQCEWFGEVTSLPGGTSVSAELEGNWQAHLPTMLPTTQLSAVAIEYGTIDTVSVLQALRADAVLHAHGDPNGTDAANVRSIVRGAFCDDDPAWFDKCSARYDETVGACLRGLAQ